MARSTFACYASGGEHGVRVHLCAEYVVTEGGTHDDGTDEVRLRRISADA